MTDHNPTGATLHDADVIAGRLVRDQLVPDLDPRCDEFVRQHRYDNLIAELGNCPARLRAVIAELVSIITGYAGCGVDGTFAYTRIIDDITRRDPDVQAAGLTADDVFNGWTADVIAENARIAAGAAFDAAQPYGMGLTAAIFAYVRTFDAEAAAHKIGVLSGERDGYVVSADWNGPRR
jgi:hypothetical protein